MINETVRVAKQYLDNELKKFEGWEDFKTRSDKSIRTLFPDEESFAVPKGRGVGRTILIKFLGANWKEWMIQQG